MRKYVIEGDGILVDEYVFEPKYGNLIFGPELEFFTLDVGTMQPKNIQAALKESNNYDKFIKPELPAEQVEITCPPMLCISNLEKRLVNLIKEVQEIAKDERAIVVPVSYIADMKFTITDNPRYHAILNTLVHPARIHTVQVASDQINVGASNEKEAFEIYNRLRGVLPLITGISVASPFIGQKPGNGFCNRMAAYDKVFSKNSKFRQLTGYPIELNTLDEYVQELQNMPIFNHPNAYYRYIRPMPQRGVAAEIRSIDKQPTLVEYLAMVALVKGFVFNERCNTQTSCQIDFRKSLRYGIYDPMLFERFLDEVEQGLLIEERKYLNPLKRRVATLVTPAQKMLIEYHDGRSVEDIFRKLSANYLGESYV
jgi:gamma-glutamyl:cysteine ligase YbdK (ATP-grasp superfamily)